MKVLLQKDVKNLGEKGSLVDVAEGYGRNYLLPRGLAVEATKGNVKQVESEKTAEKNKKERLVQEAEQTASRIEGQKLQLRAKVGDAGKLFGSITSQEIAERLNKQYKVNIDKRKIDLKEPIRSLGTFPVVVKVHPKVHSTVQVVVSEEK